MGLHRFALNATRRATGASVLTALAIQATLMVSGVLAARLLGVEDRGYLALLIIIPIILVRLGGLGLPVATTYYVARDHGQAGAIVRSLAGLWLLQTLVLVGLQVGAVLLILSDEPHDVFVAGLLTLALIPGLYAHQNGLAILQGQQRFRAFNVLRTTPVVLYTVGVVAMFVLGRDELPLITLIWVCSWAGIGLVSLTVALRGLPSVHAGDRPPPARRELIAFGLKALPGWASPTDTFRLDQAVAGLVLSPAALGLYVVGMAFTNLPRFIAMSIGMVAYPHIAAIRHPASARRSMWRFFAATTLAAFLVVVALEALAGWLVPLFFGNEFEEAVSVTRILLVGAFFFSARRILTDAARGVARPILGSVAEVASWFMLAATLPIFVPAWGIEGVAAAVAVSSALSFVMLMILVIVRVPRGTSIGDRPAAVPVP